MFFLILLLLYFSFVWGQLELYFIGAKGTYASLFVLFTVSTVTKKSKWMVFILLLCIIIIAFKFISLSLILILILC